MSLSSQSGRLPSPNAQGAELYPPRALNAGLPCPGCDRREPCGTLPAFCCIVAQERGELYYAPGDPLGPTAFRPEEEEPQACAFCFGGGEACNPGNADPAIAVLEWLAPVLCPRCKGTGRDPNPGDL